MVGRSDPDREGCSQEITSYEDWLKKKKQDIQLELEECFGAQSITAAF